MFDALIWYLSIQAAALAIWPVVARGMWPLADRGWAAAKVAGVLVLAWLIWLICMLSGAPFTRLSMVLTLGGVAAAAWLGVERYASTGSRVDVLGWIRDSRVRVLIWEAVFLAAFVFFAVLRAYQPAAAGTE